LLLGWGVLPPRSRLGNAGTLPEVPNEIGLNGWIRVAEDGSVRLAMNRSEMGQGVHTALAMLAAEELDLRLDQVQLIEAGADSLYGNVAMFTASLPFHPSDAEPGAETPLVKTGRWIVAKLARELGLSVTGGSSTVADAWEVLRLAAATARAQLLGAASLQWRLPVAELQVVDGVISHPSGQSAHYGTLAKVAAATPPGEVRLKARSDWRLIGRPVPRLDLPAKTDGSAVYGIDVRRPGQLYAVVRHCPMLGGSPGRVRVEAAMQRPGVERVVRLGPYAGATGAVAVVGRSTWHAKQGADALDIDWQPAPTGLRDSAAIEAALEKTAREAAAAGAGFAFHARGDAPAAQQRASRRVEALYRAPYLAHAAMEPINCTARVLDGKVELWVPTQAPSMARALAARAAGVSPEDVTLHVTYLGGGFGRRLEVDVVGQAVRIALETGGRPVQLVWPREEDLTHDFYRPAAAALMQAGFDAEGRLDSLLVTSAGDAITPRWIERALPALDGPVDLPDKTTSEGLFDQPYGVPNQRMAHVATRHDVPVGFWRSVGHSHNAFFSECFIDELAHAAGQDPVAFRLGLLADKPRHAAVLRLAAERSGWGRPLPAGRARGVALHESFGSIVAEVVEAGLVDGRPKLHRVVCAADVGTVVNPGIVAQQMESAVIFGLSQALGGRIDIDAGVVRQTNFPSYALPRLADAPPVETHLIASTHPPGGVGEPGTPPLAPALANALFVLTGVRQRALPLA
jgi:isoquinoline 1-oxidoreductase beta subunit